MIPLSALAQLDSPQSLEQAVRVNVPLAGGPASERRDSGWVRQAKDRDGAVSVRLNTNAAGTAHVFVVDEHGTAGAREVAVSRRGHTVVSVPLDRALSGGAEVLVGWEDGSGGTFASRVPVR